MILLCLANAWVIQIKIILKLSLAQRIRGMVAGQKYRMLIPMWGSWSFPNGWQGDFVDAPQWRSDVFSAKITDFSVSWTDSSQSKLPPLWRKRNVVSFWETV